MKLFMPERVFFEPSALNYPLGQKLYRDFSDKDIEIQITPVRNVLSKIPGDTERQRYAQSKRTLVVSTKKSSKLDICKPSADFEFSLVKNCPGSCEYCYLQTSQAYKPYLRVYVNLEDIFENIKAHIKVNEERKLQNGETGENIITTFEVASLGDPLALEHLTGSVARTIEFFGKLDNARVRIATKFSNVDSLLHLRHNGHTRFRFSINSRYVIDNFEHGTASFDERIGSASKIAGAGYPVGFIVAPIMVYNDWKEEYRELFDKLKELIDTKKSGEPVTFELIQHRFTSLAKKFILQRYPKTKLDMDEEKRVLKWGRFGRYKYVYPKETAAEIKSYISGLIAERFPDGVIEYFT